MVTAAALPWMAARGRCRAPGLMPLRYWLALFLLLPLECPDDRYEGRQITKVEIDPAQILARTGAYKRALASKTGNTVDNGERAHCHRAPVRHWPVCRYSNRCSRYTGMGSR